MTTKCAKYGKEVAGLWASLVQWCVGTVVCRWVQWCVGRYSGVEVGFLST